jgi:hypothetical protein
MHKKNKMIMLLTAFIILSSIKLFTAKVGLLGDPTVQLVVKSNPTLLNSYIMKGEDNQVNRERYKGTWYYEKSYKVITADESGFTGEYLYNLIIIAWWVLVVGIPIYMVINKVKVKQKCT